jgi:hypothetical protein
MVPFGNISQFLCLYSSIPAGPGLPITAGPVKPNQNQAWNQALGPIVLCKAAQTAGLGFASKVQDFESGYA